MYNRDQDQANSTALWLDTLGDKRRVLSHHHPGFSFADFLHGARAQVHRLGNDFPATVPTSRCKSKVAQQIDGVPDFDVPHQVVKRSVATDGGRLLGRWSPKSGADFLPPLDEDRRRGFTYGVPFLVNGIKSRPRKRHWSWRTLQYPGALPGLSFRLEIARLWR